MDSQAAPYSCPPEDPDAYQHHAQEFFDEYRPPGPPKSSSPRNSSTPPGDSIACPHLKPRFSPEPPLPSTPGAAIQFDIVDAHLAIDRLGMYGHRLSRQFHKTLEQLREIQAERRDTETRDLKRAAALLQMNKTKGIPYDPAQDGFVFSKYEIETFSQRLIRLNQSRHMEHIRFHAPLAGHA